MPYTVTRTTPPEVLILVPKVFGDACVFFFAACTGLDVQFVQDNHSRSARGVLRGLHYQIQHPQGKLVRVTQGVVFDVAVDLRRSSPTFGKWEGVLPPGFAHGFVVLSDSAEFLYKTTDYYHPEFERSLLWNDPTVGIQWPLTLCCWPVATAVCCLTASVASSAWPWLRLWRCFCCFQRCWVFWCCTWSSPLLALT